jgi:hypothetical protein
MKKSVIASLVISSIAWVGFGNISNTFAQVSPTSDPGQTPLPGVPEQSPPAGRSVDPGPSMPASTPESSASPNVIKKTPLKKKTTLKKSIKQKTMKKKAIDTTITPRMP